MTSRQRLLVLGGTGFVGRAFAAAWAALPADTPGRPALLRLPSRRPAAARALASLPGVELLPADVHDPAALRRLLEGCDAVLNLVAILHGRPAEFERVHVQLPQQLAAAARAAGVRRLLHVSALGVPAVEAGADPSAAPSHYLRSKARGEAVLRAADGLALTVLRPSVIFGAEDRFIRLFAALQALLPVMALAGAQARFQPVWVGDVARALLAVLADPASAGRTYELAGPQVCRLDQLVRAAGRWSGHERPLLPLPDWAGRLQAAALGLLPGPPLMTADNLDSMRVPNVATGRLPGLAELGIVPTRLEDVMPAVWRPATQRLDRWRARAGR